MQSKNQGTALITGASSGIGLVYAERLARRGFDLILVARQEEKLNLIANTLAAETGRSVEGIGADLTNADDVAKVERRLREDGTITMLVNDAGIAATKPLLESDAGKMEQMIRLNVTALMRLTYAAAPAFVSRKRGTIINISSSVAVAPDVLNGVYVGTKAFVLAFSQSLQHELAEKGVRIQVVLPGATATNLWESSGTRLSALPPQIVMSTDEMVDAALAGLDQGEVVTLPSLADVRQWNVYESARQAVARNLWSSKPAPRYAQHASI